MIPFDYHIHTLFSCDSQATMTEMCRSAIECRISEIGFSEHYDLLPSDPCFDFFQADAWWETLQRCRDDFQGLLTIRAGIELGEPHLFQENIQALLDNYPWDYCLGSLHWVGSKCIFDRSYFMQPPEQAYQEYYQELAKMVTQADIDVLAHMDIVKRYGFDIYGYYDPHQYEDEMRAVLSVCAEREIALESNPILFMCHLPNR